MLDVVVVAAAAVKVDEDWLLLLSAAVRSAGNLAMTLVESSPRPMIEQQSAMWTLASAMAGPWAKMDEDSCCPCLRHRLLYH